MKNTIVTDYKYILLISNTLQLFKKISDTVFTCRCPICGDSKKNPYKSRFYFIKKQTYWTTYCHNCQWSAKVWFFLKTKYPSFYKLYLKDNYIPTEAPKNIKQEITNSLKQYVVKDSFTYDSGHFIRFSQLSDTHPARIYVTKRGIFEEDLYYTKNFGTLVESLDENLKYQKLYKFTTPRLIIPFYNEDGYSFIFQGRSFGNDYLRYVTIKKREDEKKIFGLNNVDFNKDIYVVEGPIDSFFLENCIAMAGSALSELPKKGNYIFVFDNEPRNKDICKQIENKMNEGFPVFIPLLNWKYKDLNQAWMDGKSKNEINDYIQSNIYHGLNARVKMKMYKKC